MPTVLRACGIQFDVDVFLAGCTLPVRASYRVGDPVLPRTQPNGRRHGTAGVHIDVSEAEFDDFGQQVTDAIAFLTGNAEHLRRLAEFSGVDDLTLDFGIARRDAAVQCDRLPAELVQLCGRYQMSIEMSYYPPLG